MSRAIAGKNPHGYSGKAHISGSGARDRGQISTGDFNAPLLSHPSMGSGLGCRNTHVPYIPFLAHGQLPLGKDSVPLRTLVCGLTSLDAPRSTQRIRAGGTTISTSPVAMSQTRPEMNHSAGNAETARSAATSMATAARGSVIAFVLSSPSWI